jgi:hypothetical protein
VTPAQQMEMEVENGLASIRSGIDDYAKSCLRNAMFLRELAGNPKNMSNYFSIGSAQIRKRRDMLARNDQNMNRSLRIDILEGHHGAIFVDHITLNPFLDNPTEQTIAHR